MWYSVGDIRKLGYSVIVFSHTGEIGDKIWECLILGTGRAKDLREGRVGRSIFKDMAESLIVRMFIMLGKQNWDSVEQW